MLTLYISYIEYQHRAAGPGCAVVRERDAAAATLSVPLYFRNDLGSQVILDGKIMNAA
jgi:hypothetical protein